MTIVLRFRGNVSSPRIVSMHSYAFGAMCLLCLLAILVLRRERSFSQPTSDAHNARDKVKRTQLANKKAHQRSNDS